MDFEVLLDAFMFLIISLLCIDCVFVLNTEYRCVYVAQDFCSMFFYYNLFFSSGSCCLHDLRFPILLSTYLSLNIFLINSI